jgi:hypothetical protein
LQGRKIKNREEQGEDGAEIIWERREEGKNDCREKREDCNGCL